MCVSWSVSHLSNCSERSTARDESIQVWRLNVGVPKRGDRLVSKIVSKEKQDVGTFLCEPIRGLKCQSKTGSDQNGKSSKCRMLDQSKIGKPNHKFAMWRVGWGRRTSAVTQKVGEYFRMVQYTQLTPPTVDFGKCRAAVVGRANTNGLLSTLSGFQESDTNGDTHSECILELLANNTAILPIKLFPLDFENPEPDRRPR